MSTPDVQRIRDDLATIRAAAGFDIPFSRDDVRGNIAFAACGVLLAGSAAIVPVGQLRSVAIAAVVLLLAVAAFVTLRARRGRARRPATWREHRLNLLAVLIIVPAIVAYMRWERQIGLPQQAVGAAAVFFVGLGVLLVGLTRGRRHYLGGAFPLMAFALTIPFCAPRQVLIAAGTCITVAGLAMAALQVWQIRSAGAADVAH